MAQQVPEFGRWKERKFSGFLLCAPPQINKCETILRCTVKMAPTKLADFVTWQGVGPEVDRSYPVSLLFIRKTGSCVCKPYD